MKALSTLTPAIQRIQRATKASRVHVLFFIVTLTRPEKSLHFLVRSPDSNLHFLVSPKIALHLITG